MSHADPRRLGALWDWARDLDVPRFIRAHTGGVRVHRGRWRPDRYEMETIAPEVGARSYLKGATVELNFLDRTVPAVGDWIGGLAEAFQLPVVLPFAGCHAFMTARSGKSFPLHFDKAEVIVIQLRGLKRWTIAPNRDVAFPTQRHIAGLVPQGDLALYAPARLPRRSPNLRTFEMVPGSALFLPRGHWHATEITRDSLSLSFVLFTPTWHELAAQVISRRLIMHERWRKPSFGLAALDPKARAEFAGLFRRLARDVGRVGAGDLT